MGHWTKYALAGILAVATVTTTRAADLPFPSPEPVGPAPVDFGGNWYLRGDVGVGILDYGRYEGINLDATAPATGYVETQRSIGNQFFIGGGVGYQFNNWLRFDATGEYRSSASWRLIEQDTNFTPNAYNVISGNISSAVGLANLYIDLGHWWGVTPFIGAGVGVAHHWFDGVSDIGAGSSIGGIGVASDRDKTNLAWAAHAGLSYAVSPNLKLELAYRYLNMGDVQTGSVVCLGPGGGLCTVYKLKDLDSHDIKLGMRWVFGGAPEPMAEPIVRKY